MTAGTQDERAVAGIVAAVRALVRTERTVRTYPAGSQMSERAIQDLEPQLVSVLPLEIQVRRDQLAVDDHELLDHERDRSELPARLYRDGVRRIRILSGLDGEELRRFLTALSTAIHPDDLSEDYVTQLWEADLPNVRIAAIDPYLDLDVPDEVLEGKIVPTAETEEAAALDEEEARQIESTPPPPEEAFRVRQQDRDRIASEIELSENFPPWENFAAALFDALEKPQAPERLAEIARALEASFHRLLIEGQLEVAAKVLERARGKLPAPAEPHVRAALDRMVHPERLEQLQRTLEAGLSSPEQVERILLLFGSWATQPICALLESATNDVTRQLYLGVLVKIGPSSLEPVLAHLASAPPKAKRDFVRVLGQLRDPRASVAVVAALNEPDPSLRREVVRALSVLRDPNALNRLMKVALADADESVRILALRALGEERSQLDPAQLLDRTRSAAFPNLDEEEKNLLFEALGTIGGQTVLEFLAESLTAGWLPGRDDRDGWRRAASALVRLRTPEARQVLEEGAAARRKDLAAICQSALRALERENQ